MAILGHQQRQRSPAPRGSMAEVVEERRDVTVAGVHLIPAARSASGGEVAGDPRCLPGAGRSPHPRHRPPSCAVQPAEQARPGYRGCQEGTGRLGRRHEAPPPSVRAAAVAPFLVSVNPIILCVLGLRLPDIWRRTRTPGRPRSRSTAAGGPSSVAAAQRTLTVSSHVERAGRVRGMLCRNMPPSTGRRGGRIAPMAPRCAGTTASAAPPSRSDQGVAAPDLRGAPRALLGNAAQARQTVFKPVRSGSCSARHDAGR